MWQTAFALRDISPATELRRYMNCMIPEFSRVNTLEGATRTPYDQYESVVLPLRTHLQGQSVIFIINREVTEFVFADTPLRGEVIVTSLKYEEVDNDDAESLIEVRPEDFVFDTNGSVTDSTSTGDLDTMIVEDHRYSPSALLWKQAVGRFYNLDHPGKLFNNRSQSEQAGFTAATFDHSLINKIFRLTHQLPGDALNTFVDPTPLISLMVHHQPRYHARAPEQKVF